ncbi:unnamed protein product [Cyprideis torosa]|uniref:Ion transport domain-containing protein n=1 Tax=Cyprideis torosa TaxID=163714 RepID=A0A7R8W4S9_9CRUS|nr:unnamed protein product [Cyprideis torosa]CAG0879867.1 unnamed protein product [Cyprideis torosa]
MKNRSQESDNPPATSANRARPATTDTATAGGFDNLGYALDAQTEGVVHGVANPFVPVPELRVRKETLPPPLVIPNSHQKVHRQTISSPAGLERGDTFDFSKTNNANNLHRVPTISGTLQQTDLLTVPNDVTDIPNLFGQKSKESRLERFQMAAKDLRFRARQQRMSRAIKCQDQSLVQRLVLETIKDLKARNDGTYEKYTLDSALHVAVNTGDLACVYPIAEKVTAVKYCDRDGNTALHLAARKGLQRVLEILLQKEIDASHENRERKTPLILAVENSQWRCVEILVGAGERAVTPADAQAALVSAAIRGNPSIIKCLFKYFDENSSLREEAYSAAFHAAAEHGHPEVLQTLFYKGQVDVNQPDHSGRTALHACAMRSGDTDCLTFLLRKGARINQLDCNKGSALYYAAQRGNVEATRLLLEFNRSVGQLIEPEVHKSLDLGGKGLSSTTETADADSADAMGRTPLHIAALGDHKGCLELLVKRSGALNARDENGRTPLHTACEVTSKECVKVLLDDSETDLNIPDEQGNTPLHIACHQDSPEIISILLDMSAINIHARNLHGETPLHLTAAVETLHARGGEISARNLAGKSVLGIILVKMPQAMRLIMDEMVSTNEEDPESKDLTVSIDFSCFSPTECCTDELVDVNSTDTSNLMEFVNTRQQNLLIHPVPKLICVIKWTKYRSYWLTYMALYITFVIFLSMYQCSFYGYLGYKYLGNTIWDCQQPENSTKGYVHGVCNVYIVSLCMTDVLTVLLVFIELFQIGFSRRGYLQQWENSLQLLVISTVLINQPWTFASDGFHEFQHHVSAFSVLLSWTLLLSTVGRSPGIGLYITMFQKVAMIFFKLILIYFWLIIGSSLAFFILFRDDTTASDHSHYNAYGNPLTSLVKSLIMLTGELEYVDAFSENLAYPGTTHIIFLFFVMLVTLILGNLLIGLSVNNLREICKAADCQRQANLLKLLYNIEEGIHVRRMLSFPAERCEKGKPPVSFKPNDKEERRVFQAVLSSSAGKENKVLHLRLPRDIRDGVMPIIRKFHRDKLRRQSSLLLDQTLRLQMPYASTMAPQMSPQISITVDGASISESNGEEMQSEDSKHLLDGEMVRIRQRLLNLETQSSLIIQRLDMLMGQIGYRRRGSDESYHAGLGAVRYSERSDS